MKKQEPIVINIPPPEYEVTVEKIGRSIKLSFNGIIQSGGGSQQMTLTFQNEFDFYQYCDVFERAREIWNYNKKLSAEHAIDPN